MTTAALLLERMARQGLADRACGSATEAVRLTTALQAQDNPASRLGVRARSASATEGDVQRAIEDERTIVRTWLMRGTIHLVDARDLRWLVRLVGPAIARKYHTRWRQIGLTDEVLDRSVQLLPELLAAGPLNRHEIRAGLAAHGVALDSPDRQAPTHAIVHASTTGLVCRGPDRGRHSTFVLTDDWLPDGPDGPSGDEALAELARRYFAAFSPATAADFGTWSGLPSARAVALIREELTEVDVDGRPGFRLGEVEPAPGLRLLPAFDNYVIGYRDRTAILTPDRHPAVYQGGMIRPVVVLDGRGIGTWALDRTKGRVVVTPFQRLSAPVRRQVEAEAADIGRFLGREIRLDLAEPDEP